MQNIGYISSAPTFEQLVPLARAVARTALRKDAPGGDIIMDIVLDNVPIVVKARSHVCELIVCDMVIAESNIPASKSLAYYLEGLRKWVF